MCRQRISIFSLVWLAAAPSAIAYARLEAMSTTGYAYAKIYLL
ncbi:hypothetical protein [Nostoc sp.]